MKKVIKKVLNFLDRHRFILIILTIFLIASLFLGINSILFLNHNFKKFNCTQELDETYCYHNDIQIYKDPEKEKKNIFKEKKAEIKKLKEKYKLPEFNFYTSYFYEVTSLLNYNETGENEDLLVFFKNYNTSYNISNFYQENTFYYDLYYHYKINLNWDKIELSLLSIL